LYFKQIECFVQLAETLNFNTTAKLLYISQPAVSQQIKTLEAEFGFKLFIRNKRNVELTPAGVSFYADMKDVLTKTNIAISKAKNYAMNYKTNLSICYEGTLFEQEMMPEILSYYRINYPDIHFYIKHADYKECKKSIIDQKSDIIFTVQENIQSYSEISYCQLLKSTFVCVIPKDHLFAKKTFIGIEDLKNETLILLDPIKCPPEMARVQNKIQRLCPDAPILFCDSEIICTTMMKGNMGIAFMPSFVAPTDQYYLTIPLDIAEMVSYGAAWNKSNKKKEISDFIKVATYIFGKHLV